MKTIKTYKLFVEAIEAPVAKPAPKPIVKPTSPVPKTPQEDIMQKMVDNDVIDKNTIQNNIKSIQEIEKNMNEVKEKIAVYKEEVETKLTKMEELQLDFFQEENKQKAIDIKKNMGIDIQNIQKKIEEYETMIKSFQEKIELLKK